MVVASEKYFKNAFDYSILSPQHSNKEETMTSPKNGLNALLRPEDSIVVLIDHQPFQFTNLNSHDPTMIINNTVGLAKAAMVITYQTARLRRKSSSDMKRRARGFARTKMIVAQKSTTTSALRLFGMCAHGHGGVSNLH